MTQYYSNFKVSLKPFQKRFVTTRKKILTLVDQRPMMSFFASLVLVLAILLLGNFLRKPEPEIKKAETPKPVAVYSVGQAPVMNLLAKIEKSGVITISALTPGVVSQIHVAEGDHIEKGKTLVSLSSNYQGGNALSLQRQLAAAQYHNVQETFDMQKDLIQKQRDIAEKTDVNADELQKISERSLDDTRSLLDQNQDIVDTLSDNLEDLEETNVGGVNDQQILQIKQLRVQFQNAVNLLRSSVGSLEYQSNEDNPPEALANLQKEVTLKQLEIQEKALSLSKETSRLQLQLAQVQEASMFPSSPASGVVQRVNVTAGQVVSPGTALVTIAADNQTVTAEVSVSESIARSVARMKASVLYIQEKEYPTTPTFVSTEATNGQLYSVLYTVPEEQAGSVTNGGYIPVAIPLGYPDTLATIPYIPIDAVFQTQEESFVYVISGSEAKTKRISLGTVFGKFVEVRDGLSQNDQIILDRTVIAGARVVRKT